MDAPLPLFLDVALAVLMAAGALALAVLAVMAVIEMRRAAALIEGVNRVFRYPPRVLLDPARQRSRWS
ncbi:MAG: hypothetical protein HY423_07240 [Candidatus Lambdaproteobacteria bacterium]|nr:hypothetical protein [Candidatus Lambdaproteobacteria bacterium]